MKGPIGTILSVAAALIVLAAFGGAIYGLILIGPLALTAIGVGFGFVVPLLALIAKGEREQRERENAALPAKLAAIRTQRAPVLAGPVYTRPRVDIFTWVVRKQDEGRFAVFPLAKNGMELREYTIAGGLPWNEAWDIRNAEQRAIGK